ncbi:MAG: VOC family protein, partial [Actinomycetota bacterium]
AVLLLCRGAPPLFVWSPTLLFLSVGGGGAPPPPPPRLAADTPGRWIRFGDTQVHLILGDPVSRPAHFALELGDDYHFARAKIERMGSQISEARDLWGSPRCFVQDPAGNLVELFEFGPSQ